MECFKAKRINMCFLLTVLLSFGVNVMHCQITSGKITYERKTNLYKKFKDDDVKDWLKE